MPRHVRQSFHPSVCSNWRVRWKKGVGFFTQKWTLSEMLQISHAVLFTRVKQYSACFSPWSLLPFWDNYVCKKHIFLRASSGDLLLNEKQKKPFVSLNHGVTIIHESLTTASLVDEALNGPDLSLFCRDASSIWGRWILFFPSVSLLLSKTSWQIYCNWIAIFTHYHLKLN